MLLNLPQQRHETGLPQILKSDIRITRDPREYMKTGLNFTCPTGYFTFFDRFQEAMLTIRYE